VNLDEPKSLDKSQKAEYDLKKSLPPVAPKKSETREKDTKPASTPPFAPEKPAGVVPNKADDSNSLKSLEKQMRGGEKDITTYSRQMAELDNTMHL